MYMEHYEALSIEKVGATVGEMENQLREQQVVITNLSRRLRRLEEFMSKYVKVAGEEMELAQYVRENPATPKDMERGEELFQATRTK